MYLNPLTNICCRHLKLREAQNRKTAWGLQVRDVDNRQFLMFYEAVAQGGRRSVGLAVSKDGDSWKRCPQPVLTGG